MDAVKLEGPDACLAFLILNQDQWKPDIQLNTRKGEGLWLTLPLTVIGTVK
jgi:hypothetical protein